MSSSGTARPARVRTDPAQPGQEPDVVVFGQVARDLVLVVDAVPGPGRPVSVRQRREMLGGKGANQAMGLVQLGMRPVLAGVVGEDRVGQRLLAQARSDRGGISAVIQRPGERTALIVDVVDATGQRRYLEDIPAGTLLTGDDIRSRPSRRQAGADAEGHPGSTGPGYGFTGGSCWQ